MKTYKPLLLEIGCEEIPSRLMPGALAKLEQEAKRLLTEYRLDYNSLAVYSTPRRLVLHVEKMALEQAGQVETIKGPPVDRAYDAQGNPTKALDGFLKTRGASLEDISQEELRGARYVVLQRETAGEKAELVLPRLLPELITALSFPRPMYWLEKEVRFARPIRWLLALYGENEISFQYAGIDSAMVTYGHRFLAPGPFTVRGAAEYFACLENSHVVLDGQRRREMILEQLHAIAARKGGQVLVDPGLLEEVINLVEEPTAVEGHFDGAYLDLPPEVLVTTMQHHQRYFPLAEKDGARLLPVFVGISNNGAHPNVGRGYAKVLQARLADARFFYNEDRRVPLEQYVEKLAGVTFLESLGSLDGKRVRLIELAGKLGVLLGLSENDVTLARRAAHLCKADLVTSMVKEFSDLQGVMGREYARLSGEPGVVAEAIYEHYLPRNSGDSLPETPTGALLALADRLDTLAGCFAVGIQPTGSQDPYALRRQAQGVVSIMLALSLPLSLQDCLDVALEEIAKIRGGENGLDTGIRKNLEEFFLARIRFALQERSYSHALIEALLAVPFQNVVELFTRAAVLEKHLGGALLDRVAATYNRVANLGEKAEGDSVLEDLFVEEAEKALYSQYLLVSEALSKAEGDTTLILRELDRLKEPVDRFFDDVLVMVEDPRLKHNRLNLLGCLRRLFYQTADFSLLHKS